MIWVISVHCAPTSGLWASAPSFQAHTVMSIMTSNKGYLYFFIFTNSFQVFLFSSNSSHPIIFVLETLVQVIYSLCVFIGFNTTLSDSQISDSGSGVCFFRFAAVTTALSMHRVKNDCVYVYETQHGHTDRLQLIREYSEHWFGSLLSAVHGFLSDCSFHLWAITKRHRGHLLVLFITTRHFIEFCVGSVSL